MTFNRPSVVAEMGEIAEALGLDVAGLPADDRAEAAIAEVGRLFAAIGITPTLAALGLPEDKLEWTAEQSVAIDRLIKNNPRPLDLAAMRRLVRAAWDGDRAALL